MSRSTHAHWAGSDSVCLAFSGTVTDSLMLVALSVLRVSTFLPPLAGAVFLLRTSRICRLLGLGTRGKSPVFQTSRLHTVSGACWPCLLVAAHRYYDGSDSCTPSPRAAGLPTYLAHTSQRCASNHVGGPYVVLAAKATHTVCFRLHLTPASSPPSPRRIEFALLRTASSSPVALHLASQRRSYFRLQGLGLP